MTPALKLNVAVAHFPYGGNGATSSEHPDIRRWEIETTLKAKADPRIGEWSSGNYSDTPITYTRNKAIREAKKMGAHLLLFVDSDQSPDKHRGEAWFKPFWDEAFNFIYDRYSKGLVTIVGAPYCGPPDGCENVYVFQWATRGNRDPHESIYSLDQYTRNEAAMMSGIQECAALPTGMFLMDLRAADLVEPGKMSRREIWKAIRNGKMDEREFNLTLKEGYFYYEWKDQYADEKASTEDVTFTRDVALAGMAKLGYNPIHCAWDSWVGHHKPWNVGKPQRYTTEHINSAYKRAVDLDSREDEKIVQLQMPEWAKQMARENERMAHVNSNGKHNGKPKAADNATPDWLRADGVAQAPEDHLKVLREEAERVWKAYGDKSRILEVGSWTGTTASVMSRACPEGQIHCVDTFDGRGHEVTENAVEAIGGPSELHRQFVANIGPAKMDKYVHAWQTTSEKAAARKWEPFDLIFIDADHSYEAVKADILNWWKHLKDDGVMIGHDYLVLQFPGVTRAVQELFGHDIKVDCLGWCDAGGMWKVRKADFPNLLQEHRDAAPATA